MPVLLQRATQVAHWPLSMEILWARLEVRIEWEGRDCNTLGVWLLQNFISIIKHVHHLSHHAIVPETCICNIHNYVCFKLHFLWMVVVQHVNATWVSYTLKHGNMVGMSQVKIATKIMKHVKHGIATFEWIDCFVASSHVIIRNWYSTWVKWLIMV